MSENIATKCISTIVGVCDQVIQTFESNQEKIKKAENETMDLLHEIELAKIKNLQEGYQVYKELKEVREKRRMAKDENQALEELYNFCKNDTNIKAKLQKIQSTVDKVIHNQSTRKYTPKERKDLTIITNNRSFEKLLNNFKFTQRQKHKYKFL